MLVNVDKCSVIVFNPCQANPQANYTLDGSSFHVTQETNHLGVVIQSDLKFTCKISKANRQPGMIKFTLFKALEKAKLSILKSILLVYAVYM